MRKDWSDCVLRATWCLSWHSYTLHLPRIHLSPLQCQPIELMKSSRQAVGMSPLRYRAHRRRIECGKASLLIEAKTSSAMALLGTRRIGSHDRCKQPNKARATLCPRRCCSDLVYKPTDRQNSREHKLAREVRWIQSAPLD
jgi:hypothetical protein